MSEKQFDYVVFIGRFQPFHLGHEEVLRKAVQLADTVIMLVGSSNQPRTIKNPFTFSDRRQMILEAYNQSDYAIDSGAELQIVPLRDFKPDNNVWVTNVQKAVEMEVSRMGWQDKPRRGAIIGHSKDETSFYLQMFPQWELIDHAINEVVHATDIRDLYFGSNLLYLKEVVPEKVFKFLYKFKTTGDYKALVDEYNFIKKYKKAWEAAPHAPTFLTADAVVVQAGHILLVKRKSSPGKGLWALPGGFVNQNERIEDAMLRELKEETKIKLSTFALRDKITASKVFDAPDRSLRGRTVTEAFFIELNAGDLPEVKGSDDAEKAKWFPLSFVHEEELFEDHYSIITYFLGQI